MDMREKVGESGEMREQDGEEQIVRKSLRGVIL